MSLLFGTLCESQVVDVCEQLLLCLVMVRFLLCFRGRGYWISRGVPHDKPLPVVGSLWNLLLLRESPAQLLARLHQSARESRCIGFYIFNKPALVLRDPELIGHVLVKAHRQHQMDRHNEPADSLGSRNLFSARGVRWRHLRTHLSPAFSGARMRRILSPIKSCAATLATTLGLVGQVRIRDLIARYSTDSVCACLYAMSWRRTLEEGGRTKAAVSWRRPLKGVRSTCTLFVKAALRRREVRLLAVTSGTAHWTSLDTKALVEPDSTFRTAGRRIFRFSVARALEILAVFVAPGCVSKLSGAHFFGRPATSFFKQSFGDLMRFYEENGISGSPRNLFELSLLLKGKGYDEEDVIAQAGIFFTAGTETTSIGLTCCLFELATNPDIQRRLRHDVELVLSRSGGVISYDALAEMRYLDMVVAETLRKYPPLPYLERRSPDSLTLGDFVVEADVPMFVATLALHHDTRFYPQPEHFDPERFSEEAKRSRPSFSYLPFGAGPHSCIGMRLGLMIMKTAVVEIVSRFEILVCDQTPAELKISPLALLLAPAGGIPLRFKEISTLNV